ncbi:glycosyltransferase [Sutcliffiella horikoshii]|uniref:glycosyltransferase n=1 Tax=Sutcliffiella horikoshii TaxID=79883 RepID=UPI003CED171E
MYIALFIPVLTFGGAEKVVISLANGLAEKGHKVDLVLIKREGQLLETVSDKVRLVPLGSKKTFLSVWKLRNYLQENRPDILLSGLDNANIVSSLAMRIANVKTKHIITLHTNLKQSYLRPRTKLHRFYPAMMRKLFPSADHFVAVSNCVAKQSGNFLGLTNDRIEVIYNPVINSKIKEKSLEAVVNPWLNDPNYFTMVAAGRIFEAKDYPTMLKAFAKVLPNAPHARLIILGDGKQTIRREMEDIISKEKIDHAVELRGFVHNPYAYINKASLFVLSSKWEGFGNVLVEALYLNKQVISTACECGPEEILQNGKFGTLVQVGNSDELAQGMLDEIHTNGSRDKEALSLHLLQMEEEFVVSKYEEFLQQRVEETKG